MLAGQTMTVEEFKAGDSTSCALVDDTGLVLKVIAGTGDSCS